MMKAGTKTVIALTATLALTGVIMGAGPARQRLGERLGRPAAQEGPIAGLIRGGLQRLLSLRTELNLTDDQKTRIREIVKAHKEEIVPVAKDVLARRQALREAVLADSPGEEAIRSAADELGKAIGDAAVLASKIAAEVEPVLTDAQKETIARFHDDRVAAVESFLDERLAQ
jgi:Spy/CpxP family protein refolding chaperone